MVGQMVIRIVDTFFEVIRAAILIEVLLTWIPNGRYSKVGKFIRTFTAPIMEPAEKINDLFLKGFAIDFSPIIAYFLIYFIQQIILSVLVRI